MAVTHTSERIEEPPYQKVAGAEPLPGYVLLEPLGRGGYGEVWKCEAPGGLLKAIKFVGDPAGQPREASLLRQEYEAFQQVKAIRHPFLLCLERVELVEGELVMVMGLADKHIGDRFNECRTQGLPGIPRDELLCYLREAAEALDVISEQHGLQHLDVKPANLFLTAGHLQVGDYGLVSKLDGGAGSSKNRGLTPKYASPEVLRGKVHTHSDQYSLALVYFELLTGGFPFIGRSAQQMMMQHVSVPPMLSGLPEHDREPVSTALAKNPDERHISCRDFVDALIYVGQPPLPSRSSVLATPMPRLPHSGSFAAPSRSLPPLTNPPTQQHFGSESTKHGMGLSQTSLPKLVGVTKLVTPKAATRSDLDDCVPLVAAKPLGVLLPKILPVLSVEVLFGRPGPFTYPRAEEVTEVVVKAAGYDPAIHFSPDAIVRDATGAWVCQFPTTVDPRLGLMKLALIREEYGIDAEPVSDRRFVFRHQPSNTGFFGFGKKTPYGVEIWLEFPEPGRKGDLQILGQFYGKPPADYVKNGETIIPAMIESIRKLLADVRERRQHPRIPVEFSLQLYPLHSDGRVGDVVPAWSVDVSLGGIAFQSSSFPMCKYFYVEFESVPEVQDLVLLAQTVRRKEQHTGQFITASFRLED